MDVVVKHLSPLAPLILSSIIKALGECRNIRKETVSQMKYLNWLISRIQSRVFEKVYEAVDWLICLYVDSIALGILSFDIFGATAYLPKDIDDKLKVLGQLLANFCELVDTDSANADDITDALEEAQDAAEEIFLNLMNAVDRAKNDNKWHAIAFCSGTTLVGGAAGVAYGAATASAPVVVNPYSMAGLISALQGTSIGGALLGGGSTAAATTVRIVAAAAGVGLGVGAAAGLAVAVPYFYLKRNRLQAEANDRIITLNKEIRHVTRKARKLLRSSRGTDQEEKIHQLITKLGELQAKTDNDKI